MMHQPDFGTGQKTLNIYLIGLILCIILTLAAFLAVMIGHFSKFETFAIIFASACIQFFVQVICFLRLNTQTQQSLNNVVSIIFTFVILISIVIGSIWIIWSLNYYVLH